MLGLTPLIALGIEYCYGPKSLFLCFMIFIVEKNLDTALRVVKVFQTLPFAQNLKMYLLNYRT